MIVIIVVLLNQYHKNTGEGEVEWFLHAIILGSTQSEKCTALIILLMINFCVI